jgi:hypothetical protein
MFQHHYINWRHSRINCVKKYIGADYFKNKTVLELGCGHADIGNMFYELGAIITSSDARKEHLEVVKYKYPHIKTLYMDNDNDCIDENYNVIVHWGLLYHLGEIKLHLEKVLKKCDILLLETEVVDSDDKNFFEQVDENGYDQAINGKGIRPSPSYVEEILKQNGFQYKLIKDPILNSDFHCYDWEITNLQLWKHGLRRFWICWKNDVSSPLIV